MPSIDVAAEFSPDNRHRSPPFPAIHTPPALTRRAARVAVRSGTARTTHLLPPWVGHGVVDRQRIGWGGNARHIGRGMLATPRPFIAFIRRHAGADFRVSFPDFPDCVSSGKTIAEAQKNAERALALQCWRLHHAGAPVPRPSFMHEIAPGGKGPDGLLVLVPPPSAAA